MLKLEKYGYKFYQKNTHPFPMTEDLCVGIMTEEQALDFISERNCEVMLSKSEAESDLGTKFIILKSENKTVGHSLDKMKLIDGTSEIYISGSDSPTVIDKAGAYFIISPLTGWEIRIAEPHYANSPSRGHEQVRYHCASCHKRLEGDRDIYLREPFNFWQTVIKPCKDHPMAGFYLIFAK